MAVLLADLICSDSDCAAESDVVVTHPVELDAAACECGCTAVVLAVSEWTAAEALVAA